MAAGASPSASSLSSSAHSSKSSILISRSSVRSAAIEEALVDTKREWEINYTRLSQARSPTLISLFLTLKQHFLIAAPVNSYICPNLSKSTSKVFECEKRERERDYGQKASSLSPLHQPLWMGARGGRCMAHKRARMAADGASKPTMKRNLRRSALSTASSMLVVSITIPGNLIEREGMQGKRG